VPVEEKEELSIFEEAFYRQYLGKSFPLDSSTN
jgi:hypothetical protein